MTIIGNSTPDEQTSSASNFSFSHNNDGNAVELAVAFDNADVTTFTSVQYGGVEMSPTVKLEAGRSIYTFLLVGAASGANTVFVDYDGTQNNVNYLAVSLIDAAEVDTITDSDVSSGTGTTPTIGSIGSTVTDLVLGFGYLNNETIGDVTEGSGQTLVNSIGDNGVLWASEKAGAETSQSLTWVTTSQTYGVVGLSIASSSSVSVTPTDATPNDGDTQAFTFSGATGPIIAASCGGLDVFSGLSSTDPDDEPEFTIDIAALATSETSGSTPRISKDSTVIFETATDGEITTTINMQPKTGWAVNDLAATLVKDVDDYLTLIDAKHSITTVVGNQNYYKQLYGEIISPQGVYLGGMLLPFQFTEHVIQQGGSATATATSYGEKFYPFGESENGEFVMYSADNILLPLNRHNTKFISGYILDLNHDIVGVVKDIVNTSGTLTMLINTSYDIVNNLVSVQLSENIINSTGGYVDPYLIGYSRFTEL